MEPNMDIYPGLDLGFITLAHILVSVISLPMVLDYLVKLGTIAKYDNITGFDHLNNQFVFNIGIV
jgi:hypothetical protein